MNIYLSFPLHAHHHRRHIGVLSSTRWKSSIKSVLTVQVTFPPPLKQYGFSFFLFFFLPYPRNKKLKKILIHSFCKRTIYIMCGFPRCVLLHAVCFVVKRTKLRLSQSTCEAVPLLFFSVFFSAGLLARPFN